MKIKNTLIFMIAVTFALALITSCQQTLPPPVSQTSCKIDGDCACGTHKDTGDCFFGNKAYVNVEKQCPDFCTGIAAMFEIKCINDTCQQVKIQAGAECTADEDCVPEQCCHPTSCMPASQKGVCNLACTMECKPESLDCGQGYCACDNGKCTAHFNKSNTGGGSETKDCIVDEDCVPAECCHAAECVTKDKQPDCAAVLCSQECRGQTMDCGGYCACINGKCVAELNDL